MLHLVVAFVRALGLVAWRRSRLGPRRPSWTLGFEVLVEALRIHTRWLTTLPIPAMRRAAESLKGRVARGVAVRRDRVSDVPVTWFTPPEVTARVLLYLHGGGHVFGSAAQDAGIASALARVARARVVAPDYRLAPEAPYPDDVDDVMALFSGLREASHDDIVLVGLSSGGGLALATLTRLRDERLPLPSSAIVLSPMVDATATSASWSTNADVDWLAADAGIRWAKMYAGSRETIDAGISPVNAGLDALPPLLVVVGDAELLRDDALRLADNARAAGVDVTLHVEPDMVHAFMTFGRDDAPTRRTFEAIRTFLATSPRIVR
jgi:epsilon-lactone hydrolase